MKNKKITPWFHLLAVPVLISQASPGYAAVYFTVGEVQQAIFPGEIFTATPVTLTEAQLKDIQKKSGAKVRNAQPKVWKTSKGDFLVVDEVIGKHEFITYAIGIKADGSVSQIEVMDYRETYGDQIKQENWRKQFVGKNSTSALKLGKDIQNISGATLSCKHVTDGVKRTLAMYEAALK